MEIRFYISRQSGLPHAQSHGVDEYEVQEVLEAPLEDGSGIEDTRVAIGQTAAGRFLKVIYVPEPESETVFVITAYDLGPKALKALRRRMRRR
ncbi:MAG TPA: hypothetical protein VND22_00350 [Actinomycetota bacterium]|nr:hypothetical protein [Actinomycetota bacterium]